MSNTYTDPMWLEFKPLWCDLQQAGGPLLVAGGYGLFLKQHWLLTQTDIATIVPLWQWIDVTPRVTKDMDIVVGLEIISSARAQASVARTLNRHGFSVTAHNPRWQFEKRLGTDHTLLVDFHSPMPLPGGQNLQIDRVRVKHKPSLGEHGIHGRQNPEALGCNHHPFRFEIDGVAIVVPNPVAWCMMKLAAMWDRWEQGEDATRSEEQRAYHRSQAIKHARDVCRATAMATRAESDAAPGVVVAIAGTQTLVDARAVFSRFFAAGDGWGSRVSAEMWRAADLELIRRTLHSWLR